jgi:hypothetical protein
MIQSKMQMGIGHGLMIVRPEWKYIVGRHLISNNIMIP